MCPQSLFWVIQHSGVFVVQGVCQALMRLQACAPCSVAAVGALGGAIDKVAGFRDDDLGDEKMWNSSSSGRM